MSKLARNLHSSPRIVRVMLLWAACAAIAILGVSSPSAQQSADAPFVPGELLVRFRPVATEGQRDGLRRAVGSRLLRRFPHVDVEHLKLPANVSVDQALRFLRSNPDVLSAAPNYRTYIAASAPPNDPYWLASSAPNQWNMQKISAQAAWANFGTDSSDVVVGMVDTGINYNHPDLAANIWSSPTPFTFQGVTCPSGTHGMNTLANPMTCDPMDDSGHGTLTAGIVGAVGNNGIGVAGVNWRVNILPCKATDSQAIGTSASAIACINFFIDQKVNHGINIRVLNHSWGTYAFDTSVKAAFDAAGAAGILNVAAAGNVGSDNDGPTPYYPASFTSPSIVSVAASDSDDNPGVFESPYKTNYGATSVDLAAPGSLVVSTFASPKEPGVDYYVNGGTSYAAPHVSGVAVRLTSLYPNLTVSDLKNVLMSSVDQLGQWSGKVVSGGRLNMLTALISAGSVGGQGGSSAAFVRTDSTTQGNWPGAYGSGGYALANDATSLPTYAQVVWSGQQSWTWAASTTDPRALRRPVGTDRLAATWYSGTSFTIDVNITDSATHQVALYNLDWDYANTRALRVDVVNPSNGMLLDSRSITAFSNGQYLVWTIGGHVTFRVTNTGPGNAVVSGLFFDSAASPAPPTITTSPASQTISSGQTATLSVVASGTPPLTYQWYVGASGTTTTPIAGATASSYTTPALTSTTSYWVRVSNASGSANSATATVTVPAAPPSITTQPASQSITTGQAAMLSVVAAGTAPLTYQWYVGTSGTTTTPVPGATGSSYTTPPLASTTSYWVRVSNASGTTNSATATITVATGASAAAAFVRTDTATQGSWRGVYGSNGYALANDASALPSYAQVVLSGQQSWTWAASTTDPRALQRAAGADRLAATWYSGASYTIDINITDGTTHQVALYNLDFDYPNTRTQRVDVLNGTTGAVLDTRSIAAFSNGQYLVWTIGGHVTLRVTNTSSVNAVVSGLFFDNAPSLAPSITTSPASQSITTGRAATLSVAATGAPPLTYQWYVGPSGTTTTPIAGATGSSYTTPPLTSTTSYWVRVSNASGSANSATATVTVAAAAPSITTQPASQSIITGQAAMLSVAATGTAPLTYQWYVGTSGTTTTPVAGATGSSYTTPALTSTRSYWVRVSNASGSANSATATITVAAAGSNTAAFVRTDTTTQGSWRGVYGSNGYALAADATALPTYAQVVFAGQQLYTWAASTTDVRAVQRPTGTDRLAATWFSDPSYTIDVNITDGATHEVALYNLDWDFANTRAQRVDVLNGTTGAVIDTRTVTAFSDGQYLVWTIGGHVTFRITKTGPMNAVVSGLFFK